VQVIQLVVGLANVLLFDFDGFDNRHRYRAVLLVWAVVLLFAFPT
jgi:hypothetical protein